MSATDIYGLSPNEIQLSTQGANLNFFLELSELRSNFTRRLTDFAKHLDDSEIEGIKQMLATEMTYYTGKCGLRNVRRKCLVPIYCNKLLVNILLLASWIFYIHFAIRHFFLYLTGMFSKYYNSRVFHW